MAGFSRNTWHLFAVNWKAFLGFELVIHAVLTLIALPLFNASLDLAMKVSGFPYLTGENLVQFALSPACWIFCICFILILAGYALFEVSTLIVLAQASREGVRLPLIDALYLSGRRVKSKFKARNFAVIPFILVLVPLTNIALTSGVIDEIHIPEFIEEFFDEQWLYGVAFSAFIAVLMVFAFLASFSMHFFTLYEKNFGTSCRASMQLVKKRKWYAFSKILVWTVITSLITALFIIAEDMLVGALAKEIFATSTLPGIIVGLKLLIKMLSACIFLPLTYCVISQTFYSLLEMKGLPLPLSLDKDDVPTHHLRRTRMVTIGIVAVSLVLVTANVYESGRTAYLELTRDFDSIEVLAHRGASDAAPENTLAAFQLAIDEDADWIELDVQQTKDGVLVITHDSNLRRTTGHDVNIWEVTYDEIKDWDNGSFFSAEYNDSRICTLTQALDLCRDNLSMNIELKPNGHQSDDFVQQALDEINAANMHDHVGVASLNYWILEETKRIDPTMPTIYDMVFARGDVAKLEAVDIFSIDEAFLTANLVANVHAADKTVFAWVVNDESNMVKMYNLGLEGILTDRVLVAQEIRADPFEY